MDYIKYIQPWEKNVIFRTSIYTSNIVQYWILIYRYFDFLSRLNIGIHVFFVTSDITIASRTTYAIYYLTSIVFRRILHFTD